MRALYVNLNKTVITDKTIKFCFVNFVSATGLTKLAPSSEPNIVLSTTLANNLKTV